MASLHSDVLAAQPEALRRRDAERPRLGFGASPAFLSGHPACEALRGAYPLVLGTVFSESDLLPFEEALRIIQDHAEVL